MERIDNADNKKLKESITHVLEEKFKEMEFEEFLQDTADIVMQLRERIIDLEEEVFDE